MNPGFILGGEPPEVRQELGVVSLKVGVVEEVVGAAVLHPLDHGGLLLLEAVQVELADEAGEVGGLEANVSVETGGQNLTLEERLVDDHQFTVAVPADGTDPWTVHQTPEFGWESVGVDGLLHV